MEGGKKSWIKHVMAVAKKEGISYGEALKVAGKTYKKKGGAAEGAAPEGATTASETSAPVAPATGGRRHKKTRKARKGGKKTRKGTRKH